MNELFFLGLYLLCFSSPGVSIPLLPTASLEAATHEPHLEFPFPSSAAAMEIARANKINDTLPLLLARVSAPVMLFKQWINVEQLVNASRRLAEADRIERNKARQRKAG